MNTANVKKYAPKARNAFIAAVTKQAARYGVTAKGIKPIEQRGDVALIGEQAFSKAVFQPRRALERVVEQMGFAQAMEQAAYSWFNRLCAIRYMEVHSYLDHGRRVLSSADGEAGVPQILDDCLDIDLPGLSRKQIEELKLDGNKDEELYRELLLAQCHALHEAMPFLFEAVDDATELLLPDNLTKTDSLVRELVSAIPEDNWQDVEIIGWLYQFYISEKKDQVIGKVVKSEDIPAATQLFTPNWIVQYLVQNSVGRQWLQTYPDSPLRSQMPYYIEPGEQPPEVQAQMAETVPTSIDPESIKVLDPACGSGHILNEAYKVLKAIYEERGYRSRDIPQLILKHNLFGLDIDDRAGQLAGFALMMLAREDDRRLFSRMAEGNVTLNVLSLKETGHLDLPQLWRDLNLSGDWEQGSSQSLFETEHTDLSSANADERYQLLERTLERFEEAKTFGSLIEVPEEEVLKLRALVDELDQVGRNGDSMQKPSVEKLLPYMRQAWILAQRYSAVIANPPYMGNKGMTLRLKEYARLNYPNSKSDLFSMYMERCLAFGQPVSEIGLLTPYVWMYISSYEKLRKEILSNNTLSSLVQLEYNAFEPAMIPVCAYNITKSHLSGYIGFYVKLSDFKGHESQAPRTIEAIEDKTCKWSYFAKPDGFQRIPGSPIAYDYPLDVVFAFDSFPALSEMGVAASGIQTSNNEKYLRLWHEVSWSKVRQKLDPNTNLFAVTQCLWLPHNKGGGFRRWYGNNDWVLKWNLSELQSDPKVQLKNMDFQLKESVTWSHTSSSTFSVRYSPPGLTFNVEGPVYIPYDGDVFKALGFFASSTALRLMGLLNPTLHFLVGSVKNLPYQPVEGVNYLVKKAVNIAKIDWNNFETSQDFVSNPLRKEFSNISESFKNYCAWCEELRSNLEKIELEVNGIVSDAYSVKDPFSKKVRVRQLTLNTNPAYRYWSENITESLYDRFSSDTFCELISYAVGCMMGRYSLEKPGLILASQGEKLQDYLEQIPSPSFAPDESAILPLTDQEWFSDDATNRFREFIRAVWGEDHLQENLDFVAENLCLHAMKSKRGESALNIIRRYLSTQFYKDHLRTYKKRPIYWLFSSGKQKAFECLVYLHRYDESTLARMRTEYVIPLSAKLNTYAEKLEQDKDASTSTAETKRLEKEVATLYKQQTELAEFDEKLRHYADQRISLDLDDGVKVNYGKFGDLLAEVKAVTGQK
jgi:type II restriction/modification system DNA methylase subunit YeeA